MKRTRYKSVVMLLFALSSAGLPMSSVTAGSYADPSITDISAALGSAKNISPNIFLVLDDSGSMRAAMPYDPSTVYSPPPNPNSFNDSTGEFNAFTSPTSNPTRNGFKANSITTNDNSFYDRCLSFRPTGSTRQFNDSRLQFIRGRYFYQYVRAGSAGRDVYAQNTYTETPDTDANCRTFKSFYGTRILALKSALAIAITSENRPFSIDYDFINNDGTDSIQLKNVDHNNVTAYKTQMSALLKELYKEDARGGTPVRQQVLNLYNRIRTASTVKDVSNIFLPSDSGPYSDSSLLSCKQNYSIVLSDGAYNGSLYTADNQDVTDSDAEDYLNLTWQKSNDATPNDLTDTVNTIVNFKGDGSIPEQRLFAGGKPSLVSEPYLKKESALTSAERRIAYGCFYNYDRYGRYLGVWCYVPRSTARLSDIVFDAWRKDLNTGLENRVKPSIDLPGERKLVDSTTNTQIGSLPEIWNPDNDPANWQRIVSYTIGLGVGQEWTDQSIASIINDRSSATFSNPNGTYVWAEDPEADFARSGYVGRGGFSRVDNSKELVETFQKIFDDALSKSKLSAASGTASSAAQITTQSAGIIFSTEIDTGLRTGNLKGTWMYNGIVDDPSTTGVNEGQSNGGVNFCYGQDTPPAGAFAGQLCTKSTAHWSAIDKMPSWNARKIFSYNPTTKKGIPFTFNQMDDAQKGYINAMFAPSKISTLSDRDAIINFLKGDNSLVSDTHNDIIKRPDGASPSSAPLGDFGRGGPTFLGSPDTTIWGATLTADEKDRAVAFAGANDGMLHAFDAITGEELFAYVPNAIYKKLDALVLPNQDHTAFVDGQIVTKDIDNKKTLLVSGMGAGAKGLFALDVTSPDGFNKNNVLWEIDASVEPRIGRIFGKPSIIRVEGKYHGIEDRWVVVVGTGYNNNTKYTNENNEVVTNEDSGILVIDALTGIVLDFLKLPTSQGVGEILWVDHQQQKDSTTFSTYYSSDSYWGEMDRGYVGDLKGNVWVLDFAYDSDSTAGTTLKSAIIAGGDNDLSDLDGKVLLPEPSGIINDGEPTPLFIATDKNGNRQPITTRMTVQPHPSNRGYMVYFGTGELFDPVPFQSTTSNSMYGIWDDIGENYEDIATDNILDNNRTRNRLYLTSYPWETITTTFAGGGIAYARVPSSGRKSMKWANFQGNRDSEQENAYNPADRSSSASGWVVDTGKSLEDQYERVFQPPYSVINEFNEEGITFSMSTLEENSDPCINSSGAYTWNMTFRTDVIDGPFAAFSASQSDTNRDGVITASDMITHGGSNSVALGALSASSGVTASGVPSLEYNPTVVQSPRGGLISALGAGDFCPSGTARSYKKALSSENQNNQIVEEVNVCIPSTMSSWSEIE